MLLRYLLTATLSLCIASPSMAETPQAKDIDYSYSEEDFSPCGVTKTDEAISALPAPDETQIGELSYVTGGTCSDEVRFMKSIASQFPLEIVMVENVDNREIYIADVHVTISNSQQEQLLDIVSDGPFLLVKLPDGEYQITANFRGIEQVKKVKIQQKKHSRVVLVWQHAEE